MCSTKWSFQIELTANFTVYTRLVFERMILDVTEKKTNIEFFKDNFE